VVNVLGYVAGRANGKGRSGVELVVQ
jgi:hypothetical protein